MRLADMAWGNLWRRKGRAVFLLLTIVFSVSTATTMLTVTRSMRAEIGDAFDRAGANVLILPEASRRFSYAGVALPAASVASSYLPESSAAAIRTIKNRENVAVIAPKLLAVVNSPQGRALAVGVLFPAELRLRKWWAIRVSRGPAPGGDARYAPAFPPLPLGPAEILLGAQVARRWGADVNDVVSIDGRDFRVAGVVDPTGPDEDRAVWMDLGALQGLTHHAGQVSLIEIAALCNSCPIDEIVRQVSDKLPGTRVAAVKAAVDSRRVVVDRFGRFAVGLSVTAAVLGALAVALAMLGSVKERTREIGIMRAVGFRRTHVLAVFYLEAGGLGLLGGGVGSVLGASLARVLGPAVAGMRLAVPWNPVLLGTGTAAAVLLTLAACALPAALAARLDPVRALRLL